MYLYRKDSCGVATDLKLMASKRMFTQKIVCSDDFLSMPFSAQALYFQLNMIADDDGFLNNSKRITKMIGASEEDLQILIDRKFLIQFDSGVTVIKHWRMHNLLRKDRYNPTEYQEEFKSLYIKENGSYTTDKNQMATKWQPNGNQMATKVRLGKVRTDNNKQKYDFEKLKKIIDE